MFMRVVLYMYIFVSKHVKCVLSTCSVGNIIPVTTSFNGHQLVYNVTGQFV